VPVPPTEPELLDHVDRLIERLAPLRHVDIDLETEAIVDRIGGIHKRIKRGMQATLVEHGLTHPDWQVLTTLRLWRSDHRSSPGELAADLELSSGAMTSRLDRLEEAGYIRRLPDPEDRRGIVVELTEAGTKAWDEAASVQGRREAFFASALTTAEQQQLNGLLRKLMLAFERVESPE
jgi:DNA-binding MarR family transcriptional regulator